jgi:hypothetical protein
MAYPAAIHSYTAVDGTTLVADAGHAAMHNAVGSAVTQIETTIGTNSGTAVLKNATDGKFAVMNTGGTLDAGVLGTPMVRGGTIGTALIGTSTIQGGTVNSKIGLLTNGTIGTTLVGTSTIQGGTANLLDLRGYLSTPQYATCAGTGGTTTLDLSLTNEWRVTFGTNNGTLAVSNAVNGQKFIVSLTQDAVGTRTVVWFPTIKWTNGNGTPTLTATADKRDTFGFIATSGTTFDGFSIGLNS